MRGTVPLLPVATSDQPSVHRLKQIWSACRQAFRRGFTCVWYRGGARVPRCLVAGQGASSGRTRWHTHPSRTIVLSCHPYSPRRSEEGAPATPCREAAVWHSRRSQSAFYPQCVPTAALSGMGAGRSRSRHSFVPACLPHWASSRVPGGKHEPLEQCCRRSPRERSRLECRRGRRR